MCESFGVLVAKSMEKWWSSTDKKIWKTARQASLTTKETSSTLSKAGRRGAREIKRGRISDAMQELLTAEPPPQTASLSDTKTGSSRKKLKRPTGKLPSLRGKKLRSASDPDVNLFW